MFKRFPTVMIVALMSAGMYRNLATENGTDTGTGGAAPADETMENVPHSVTENSAGNTAINTDNDAGAGGTEAPPAPTGGAAAPPAPAGGANAADMAKAEKERKAQEKKAAADKAKADKEEAKKKRDKEKQDKIDAKAKADKEKADKKAATEEAKAKSTMPERNGIRRPKPETLCGKAWTVMDEMSKVQGSPVAVADLLKTTNAQGLNEGNVKAEYARWRKYNGIAGRIQSVATQQAAAATPAVPPAPAAPGANTTEVPPVPGAEASTIGAAVPQAPAA
jgi:hypothetical protein